MNNNSQLERSVHYQTKWFTRLLAAIGLVMLLSGFTSVEVEFISVGVPPSDFKIRLAEKKGLPPPEGDPGSPVTATLTKPEGDGPFPAVVMFPNGGGWQNTPGHWRERFNSWGYVTMEVGDETMILSQIEPKPLVLQAIGALKYLQEIPYVDGNRIAIMGWDQGAETALWSIEMTSWANKHKNHQFVTAVAIYPPCDLFDASQFFAPALIISPELSDFASPARCERFVKNVPVGMDVPILKIIPGAYQWFDSPHRPAQLEDKSYTKAYDHTYEYNAQATEAAAVLVRSFLETHF